MQADTRNRKHRQRERRAHAGRTHLSFLCAVASTLLCGKTSRHATGPSAPLSGSLEFSPRVCIILLLFSFFLARLRLSNVSLAGSVCLLVSVRNAIAGDRRTGARSCHAGSVGCGAPSCRRKREQAAAAPAAEADGDGGSAGRGEAEAQGAQGCRRWVGMMRMLDEAVVGWIRRVLVLCRNELELPLPMLSAGMTLGCGHGTHGDLRGASCPVSSVFFFAR